jgi:hypothetical protein
MQLKDIRALVAADLADERHVARKLGSDFGVHGLQVVGDKLTYVLELHDFLATRPGRRILAAIGPARNAASAAGV